MWDIIRNLANLSSRVLLHCDSDDGQAPSSTIVKQNILNETMLPIQLHK